MFHLERRLIFLLVQELNCKPGKGIYNFLHITIVVRLEIIIDALFIITQLGDIYIYIHIYIYIYIFFFLGIFLDSLTIAVPLMCFLFYCLSAFLFSLNLLMFFV